MSGAEIPVAMMVASQVMGAFSQHSAANSAAGVDAENARRAELEGAYREEAIRRRGRAVSGEAIAALGANGVAVGSGSAQDLLFQNALEAEYDALGTRYSAATEAYGLRRSAASKRAAGKMALIGGLMRAGAQAASGMQDISSAAAAAKDAEIVRAARFPGAPSLPMPGASPWYIGGKFGRDY